MIVTVKLLPRFRVGGLHAASTNREGHGSSKELGPSRSSTAAWNAKLVAALTGAGTTNAALRSPMCVFYIPLSQSQARGGRSSSS